MQKIVYFYISELNVSYRVVSITELMAYEFAQAAMPPVPYVT